jgi:hypothetical protein
MMGKQIETEKGGGITYTQQESEAIVEAIVPNADYTYVPPTEEAPGYIEFEEGELTDIEAKQIEMAMLGAEGQVDVFTALVDAKATLDAYIALASPSTAQNTAQIKAQAEILLNLIRYSTREFDL